MRPRTILLFLCLVLIAQACTTPSVEEKRSSLPVGELSQTVSEITLTFDSTATGLEFKSSRIYSSDRQNIEDYRLVAREHFLSLGNPKEKKAFLDTVMQEFTTRLLNQIIPHWYGTEWDFNGHTDMPGEGEIACGYFVSTALKHMGVQVNRYHLAQEGGWNEAKSIAIDHSTVRSHRNTDGSSTMTSLFQGYKDGLYYVGLSNHVGFIYLKDEKAYFLHSNYIEDRVMIELAEDSDAFRSDIYVLAPVTHNRELARKWILGEKVEVVRG